MSKLPFTIGRDMVFGRDVTPHNKELHDLLTGPPGTPSYRIDWWRVVAWLIVPPVLWAVLIIAFYFFTH
jgi:hypothetical protein